MSERVKIADGIRGKIEVRLTGRETERFIRLCGANGIELRRLRREEDGKGFRFTIWSDEFVSLRPYLKKTRCRARITAKEGVPFYLKKRRRRWLFPVGVLLGAAFLFILSQFIWKIDFEGNVRYTDDTLYRFLAEQEVSFGTLKSSVYAAGLEEAVRDQFADITWVSVKLSGTHMVVSVKEDDQPKTEVNEQEPCHIVSTEEGTITSIVVRSGQTELKAGDPIMTGQILISGELQLKDDGGNITDTRQVHADGEVYARVSYQYSDRFLMSHEVRTYTGEESERYTLVIGDRRVSFPVIGTLGEHYDVVTERGQLYLGSDYYFPCYLEKRLYRNYELIVENYTEEEAHALAKDRMENYLDKLSQNGYEIQSSEMKVIFEGAVCVVSGEFTAVSEVGQKEALDTLQVP